LVAGYCISENFKIFNDLEKAKKTWLFTILLSVSIILLACLLPENIPTFIFPVIYVSITSYFLKTYQEKDIQKHISNGGETYNGWRMLVIGLISIVALFAVIISLVMLADYA
jgi:mannitol-specific phosphotransferase system IIBC component